MRIAELYAAPPGFEWKEIRHRDPERGPLMVTLPKPFGWVHSYRRVEQTHYITDPALSGSHSLLAGLTIKYADLMDVPKNQTDIQTRKDIRKQRLQRGWGVQQMVNINHLQSHIPFLVAQAGKAVNEGEGHWEHLRHIDPFLEGEWKIFRGELNGFDTHPRNVGPLFHFWIEYAVNLRTGKTLRTMLQIPEADASRYSIVADVVWNHRQLPKERASAE